MIESSKKSFIFLYEAAEQGLSYGVVHLDFSNSFDRVPHQRLLTKVKAHGIDGKVSDREQRVQINGKKSNWDTVNSILKYYIQT